MLLSFFLFFLRLPLYSHTYVLRACLLRDIYHYLNFFQMSFKEALFEIHKKDMIPLRRVEIKDELENVPYSYPLKKHVSSSYLFFSLTLWWIFFFISCSSRYLFCLFLSPVWCPCGWHWQNGKLVCMGSLRYSFFLKKKMDLCYTGNTFLRWWYICLCRLQMIKLASWSERLL